MRHTPYPYPYPYLKFLRNLSEVHRGTCVLAVPHPMAHGPWPLTPHRIVSSENLKTGYGCIADDSRCKTKTRFMTDTHAHAHAHAHCPAVYLQTSTYTHITSTYIHNMFCIMVLTSICIAISDFTCQFISVIYIIESSYTSI